MRKLLDWIHGWALTLEIRIFNPKLYHHLRDQLREPFNPDDFTEVGPPE